LLTIADKSEQGQECAISHPLPTNPDGTAMSESQYKAYQELKGKGMQPKFEDGGYYDSSFEASGSAEVM
jgi:hypothetical protein